MDFRDSVSKEIVAFLGLQLRHILIVVTRNLDGRF